MQQRLSVHPDVGGAEFEALLDAVLAHRGQAALERLVHDAGAGVHPELSRRVAAHGAGVQALTFHEPWPGEGVVAPPVTVMDHAGGADDRLAPPPLPLARALSAGSGGWALAMAADRGGGRHALGAFYAGRTIEALVAEAGSAPLHRGADPAAPATELADEDAVRAALVALHRAIGGGDGDEAGLHRASARRPVRSWIVAAADVGEGGRPTRLGAGEPGLRRAAFLDVDAARVRRALAAAGVDGGPAGRLRLVERAAPVTGAPYVILDGAFDDAEFVAVARGAATQAAAVEMQGDEDAYTWCAVDLSGRARAGLDRGAARLARLWAEWAVTLGEPAAIVRVPPADGG